MNREVNRPVDGLHVHSFNLEVYGEPDDGLADSLDNFGLQHPIQVDPDGGILSGARRWTAAKALGWTSIRCTTPDLDYTDEVEVQKYVLLANAYRKQKTSYMQKREADAYYRMLNEGKVTKGDLRVAAREKGHSPPPGGQENRPVELAARAAGMSPTTYDRFRYIDDPNGAEAEIDRAKDAGEIAPQQASYLKGAVREDREKVKRDEVGVKTADQAARRRLKEARVRNQYTDEQQRAKDAGDAFRDVQKRGEAFVNAIQRLSAGRHGAYLDDSHALVLVGLIQDAMDAAKDLKGEADGSIDERKPVALVN